MCLPEDAEAVERFACFFGYEQPRGVRQRSARASQCRARALWQAVRGRSDRHGEAAGRSTIAPVRTTRGCSIISRALGFKKPLMVAETVRQWIAGEYRVFRSESTRNAFIEFVPALIDGLAHAEEPDSAVTAFDRFLQALQRGGRLISLLSQNRDLVALLALDPRRRAAARRHAGAAAANHGRADRSALLRRHAGPARTVGPARSDAGRCQIPMKNSSIGLRLFGQESLFLIGTRILSGTVSAQQASVAFADVAEGIVDTVHGLVTDRFAAQHGQIKGQETAILAMGRLGSREMTASSDLDLILLYDFDPEHPGFRRPAIAAWRTIFRALHPAADQRLHHADQLRRAL